MGVFISARAEFSASLVQSAGFSRSWFDKVYDAVFKAVEALRPTEVSRHY